jgi:hypothetical protein
MVRRSLFRSRFGAGVLVVVATLIATAAVSSAAPARPAATLPSPFQFVSNLDLECFGTSAYTPPPLTSPLTLSHLNPVLANQPRWTVSALGPRTQLCSPVAKNGKIPPTDVLEFIRFVDLSCYRIGGPTLNLPLVLSHLNPVLSHLPRRQVTVLAPQQLCVPVAKNESVLPPDVLKLVQFIDLACYGETPAVPMNESLRLTQLNPVLTQIPDTDVRVASNRQLCVPVRKNQQVIPTEILKIVQWIDLEKFDIVAPTLHLIDLRLRHINPLLAGLPAEPATLVSRQQLAVPVAKNGNIPPA